MQSPTHCNNRQKEHQDSSQPLPKQAPTSTPNRSSSIICSHCSQPTLPSPGRHHQIHLKATGVASFQTQSTSSSILSIKMTSKSIMMSAPSLTSSTIPNYSQTSKCISSILTSSASTTIPMMTPNYPTQWHTLSNQTYHSQPHCSHLPPPVCLPPATLKLCNWSPRRNGICHQSLPALH